MPEQSQRAAEKAATQQRIVDAAFAQFARLGYEAASMSQIARQAGTSRANLYLHFASKNHIVLFRMKTIEPRVRAMYDRLADLVDLDDFTEERLLAWLRSSGKAMWQGHRTEFDAITRATASDDDVLAEWLGLHRRVSARLADRLVPQLTGDDRTAWEAHLTTLMVGLERNFYFIYNRGHAEREEFALRGLSAQWFALLGVQH